MLWEAKVELCEDGVDELVRDAAVEDVLRRDAPAEEVEDEDFGVVELRGCYCE